MVTLVATNGTGSMDIYGQKLRQHMNTCSIHLSFPEPFGTPLLSPQALGFLFHSYKTLKTLRQHKILHLTNHHLARFIPLLKKSVCILTVHDLIRHFDRQGLTTYIRQPTFRDRIDLWLDWQGIKRARHIIAVSHHTKRDLISYAGVPEERITVVYHGVDHDVFYPRPEPKPVDYPYILFVGSEHPRKNLATLLKAFRQLKRDARFRQLKMVKVGKAGGKELDFRAQTLESVQSLGLTDEVVFTGFISEEMLVNYYSHAECFVMPSLYEGFGWPPLEAMACGCPVIVSNVASLPEITGEAAIKIAPYDTDSMVSALQLVLTDERLRRDLVSKGFEQARQFSWQTTAKKTLNIYRKVEASLATRKELPKDKRTTEEERNLPIYEYECTRCSFRFELKQSFYEDIQASCPQCGAKTHRVFSPVTIIFKGSGFYSTDSRLDHSHSLHEGDTDKTMANNMKS